MKKDKKKGPLIITSAELLEIIRKVEESLKHPGVHPSMPGLVVVYRNDLACLHELARQVLPLVQQLEKRLDK